MKRKSYINKEVADLLQMKTGTVAYYTNHGFVEPEIDNPKGRGTTRRYSRRNLVEFLLILELQKHGMSLPKIKEILEQAKNKAPQEQFKAITGKNFKEGFNLWDGLNFDDPIIRNIAEIFIIIYDDDKNLLVKFKVLGGKKSDDELRKLSKETIRHEIKRFLEFKVDMDLHDSALVINVSELWRTVMGL